MPLSITPTEWKETARAQQSARREEVMRQICGGVPEESINTMKADMSGFIRAARPWLSQFEEMLPDPFDASSYRSERNHMRIEGEMTEVPLRGFSGSLRILSDLHGVEVGEGAPVTDLVPPVVLNDLVVRSTSRPGYDNRRSSCFDVFRYDEELEVMFYSKWEKKNAWREKVARKPSLLRMDGGTGYDEVFHPAELSLVHAAVVPARWVITMLVVGMKGLWTDMSFHDFPVLMSWGEDEPYMLYRDFARKNLGWDGDHGVLEEILNSSFGFQRHLIHLSENREKVVIEQEKAKRSVAPSRKQGDAEGERATRRSVIKLDDGIVIHAKDAASARKFREIRKCDYRFSVRGHWRTYKSRKRVWIKPFDKNKDKPFRPHQYGQK